MTDRSVQRRNRGDDPCLSQTAAERDLFQSVILQ
jgi:hypothetical protein